MVRRANGLCILPTGESVSDGPAVASRAACIIWVCRARSRPPLQRVAVVAQLRPLPGECWRTLSAAGSLPILPSSHRHRPTNRSVRTVPSILSFLYSSSSHTPPFPGYDLSSSTAMRIQKIDRISLRSTSLREPCTSPPLPLYLLSKVFPFFFFYGVDG